MEFLPSKKIPLADGLPRLIPKIREPLEETVSASLSPEMCRSSVVYCTCIWMLFTCQIMRRGEYARSLDLGYATEDSLCLTHWLKEFLEYAGGERWPTVGTEFVWGAICLEQAPTDGHQLGCDGMTWF